MGQMGLPPLTPLTRNVLVVLFAAYVAELFLANIAGLSLDDMLAWHPIRDPRFASWQPVTRYLVQGPGVFNVVLSGVVLYFFFPILEGLFARRAMLEALVAGAIGGSVLGFLVDALGLATDATFGWSPLVTALVALFGLARPRDVIRLFFVLPVPASIFAWGTGFLALLYLLAAPGLSSADHLGTWAGAIGWWFLRGPGARNRQLRRKSRVIEKELHRFTVIDGGRDNRDDDFVH